MMGVLSLPLPVEKIRQYYVFIFLSLYLRTIVVTSFVSKPNGKLNNE